MNKAFCVILFSILSILLIFSAPVGLLPSINAALLTIKDDYGLTGTNPSVVAISSITHSQNNNNNNNPFLSSNRDNGLNQLNPYPRSNLSIHNDSLSSPIAAASTPSTSLPSNTSSQIYTPKPGGAVFTVMNTTGRNCKSAGIRFNIANEHTLVDRESTWIFTLDNDPASCTNKPWWSPKIGSHGSTDEPSGLYEASVPYSGGFHLMRTEGPHPQYYLCSGYQYGNIPPMPKGKPIGIKTASWKIPNGVHAEWWYDFTGGGKGPWIKYASLDDTSPGHCNGGSITGPIGMNGTLTGPAPAQDTMRMNGANATYISGSIVELAPGQTPKGSEVNSTSTQLSSTLNASAISKIGKKSSLTLDFQEFSVVVVAVLALVYLQQTIND